MDIQIAGGSLILIGARVGQGVISAGQEDNVRPRVLVGLHDGRTQGTGIADAPDRRTLPVAGELVGNVGHAVDEEFQRAGRHAQEKAYKAHGRDQILGFHDSASSCKNGSCTGLRNQTSILITERVMT